MAFLRYHQCKGSELIAYLTLPMLISDDLLALDRRLLPLSLQALPSVPKSIILYASRAHLYHTFCYNLYVIIM